jgi:hypothetical protein
VCVLLMAVEYAVTMELPAAAHFCKINTFYGLNWIELTTLHRCACKGSRLTTPSFESAVNGLCSKSKDCKYR